MRALFVIYDASCGLCSHLKDWLLRQPAYVSIYPVPGGSPEAEARFPGLPAGEFAAVSDSGEVWLGDAGRIVCLWTLRDYRRLAIRLCHPYLRPIAAGVFAAVSSSRYSMSRWLGLRSDVELQRYFNRGEVAACPAPQQ